MTKIQNKLLFAFILVSLIPLISLGGYALINISDSLRSTSNSKLKDKVTLVSSSIEDFLENVNDDLFYLRDSVSLQALINSEQTDFSRKSLEQDFLAFSKNKHIYHQIRFLDVTGMEIVRVDRNGDNSEIVTESKLQNKQKRYYFTDTAKLANGKLMISPLDLNREKGEVEQPLRPVIRYGTPVYDSRNQLRGVVLFNVMANKFLELVREKNNGNEKVIFISENGYYFSSPDKRKEWGAKSDLDTNQNFENDFPTIAGQIIGSTSFKTVDHDKFIVATAPVFLDRENTKLLGDVVDIVSAKDALSLVITFRNIFLLISAGVFLATLVLAISLAKSITEPIIYLTQMTHDMSKGKLSSPITVSSKDETKLLAESIDRLRKSMIILLKRMNKKS